MGRGLDTKVLFQVLLLRLLEWFALNHIRYEFAITTHELSLCVYNCLKLYFGTNIFVTAARQSYFEKWWGDCYTGQLSRKYKATENFGKLSCDCNIQGDCYIQRCYYKGLTVTSTCSVEIERVTWLTRVATSQPHEFLSKGGSDKVARGLHVLLEGFLFAFCTKNEERLDLH